MLGKTAQKTWVWGADPSKRAAVHCRESGNGWRAGLRGLLRRDAQTTASGSRGHSSPPPISFEYNLAKAILLYEEGGLPSASITEVEENLSLDGSASKCHRQTTFQGFWKHPSDSK